LTLAAGIAKYQPPFKKCFMSKVGNYIQEAYDELMHKVTWPSWDELQQTTVIVLVALIMVTAVVGGMDLVSQGVLTFIYKILGK
jgi:preprotein translocase subunit SecE